MAACRFVLSMRDASADSIGTTTVAVSGGRTMLDMLRGAVDDATARHLEEIATDILGLLGPGVELAELATELAGREVILRARYVMAGEWIESVGRGASAIQAHADLRRAVVEDRIGLGLRVLV